LIIPEQRERERERERCSKLEIELTLPKQLIPRSSSRDTTTNTVATVATAHAGVCSSDFCCSAMFWSTGPKTNSLHLHTHLQLNPKIFYGKKKKTRKKNSQSQDQAALQQHELYKTCAFAASEIKMHRFKGSYISSAKTYCQSTIVADIWSSILLLLLLLLITVCQLGLK
jgi:hypothetical protein